MRTYQILKTDLPLPALTDAVFDPENCAFTQKVPFAPIDQYVWPGDYRCEARAYVTCGEDAFNVLMCAKEETIQTQAVHFNDAVCRDSCLEFFIQPVEKDARYINFEVSAAGVVLIGIGVGRGNRTSFDSLPAGMDVQHSKHAGGWWAVRYRIPFALIESVFGELPSANMRGNFYCCDETIHPHFGTWNPVEWDHPDFHRPECFGEIQIVTGK